MDVVSAICIQLVRISCVHTHLSNLRELSYPYVVGPDTPLWYAEGDQKYVTWMQLSTHKNDR